MRILHAADYKTMPWKNGMGATTEIAICPPGAALDDFDWRVSMAQVASDGPFSSFDGIDRTLLLLDGPGIDLCVAGAPPARIDRNVVHAFPGDLPTSATLIDGPIIDLNVMTRRGVLTHQVQRVNLAQSQDFTISAPTLFVIEQGVIDVVAPVSARALGRHDAIILDSTTPMLTLSASAPAGLIAISFG